LPTIRFFPQIEHAKAINFPFLPDELYPQTTLVTILAVDLTSLEAIEARSKKAGAAKGRLPLTLESQAEKVA